MSEKKPIRYRTSWAKGKSAGMNDPPANPGYGEFDQDHPAVYGQPTEEDLAKGDPSSWAEDPNTEPYKEGEAPANPGYEDTNHPAMYAKAPLTASQRIARDQKRISQMAIRCTHAARKFLGKNASALDIERLGTVLMNDPSQLAVIETPKTSCLDDGMEDPSMDQFDSPDIITPDDVDDFDDFDAELGPADGTDLGIDDGIDDMTLESQGVFGSNGSNNMDTKLLKEIAADRKSVV